MAQMRFEYLEVDAERWESIKKRSRKVLGCKFEDLKGETGGDPNVSWRYMPKAKLLIFVVIADSERHSWADLELLFQRLLTGLWPVEIDLKAFRTTFGPGKVG